MTKQSRDGYLKPRSRAEAERMLRHALKEIERLSRLAGRHQIEAQSLGAQLRSKEMRWSNAAAAQETACAKLAQHEETIKSLREQLQERGRQVEALVRKQQFLDAAIDLWRGLK